MTGLSAMERSLLVLMCLLSLANAQCAAEDDPLCVYWVANGFCSSWGFPQSMIQQYCPKSCPDSGCTCPAGATLVGPAYNNTCSSGTLRGSVCCQSVVSCSPSLSIGPCNADNTCSTPGYACDTTNHYCCPIVNYNDPANVIGPAIGGICPIGYVMVMIPGASPEGECVSLQSVPGVCAESVQQGVCPTGLCTTGYTCFTLAQFCCPSA